MTTDTNELNLAVPKKTVSLFSGAGGLDLGFVRAGCEVVWANDSDKDSCRTYSENIGPHIRCGRIEEQIDSLPQHADLVVGGPPCQGFSVAGKMDPNDPRSRMIWEFLRVVEVVQPRAFVMENVKALGVLEKWDLVRAELIRKFSLAGFDVKFGVLNSKDFGVPQARERVFFIGVRRPFPDWDFDDVYSFASKPRSVRAVLTEVGMVGTKQNPQTCAAKITLSSKPVLRKSPYAGMLFNGLGRPVRMDGPSQTLPASMGGNKTPIIDNRELYDGAEPWVIGYHRSVVDRVPSAFVGDAPDYLRRMTLAEASAIQTFPSTYIWCGAKSSVYRQIGNAVPPNMAEAVARFLMKLLSGDGVPPKQTRLL
jgi:DNA (cytosine-5)-methyltransferase 1